MFSFRLKTILVTYDVIRWTLVNVSQLSTYPLNEDNSVFCIYFYFQIMLRTPFSDYIFFNDRSVFEHYFFKCIFDVILVFGKSRNCQCRDEEKERILQTAHWGNRSNTKCDMLHESPEYAAELLPLRT